jgi:predicted ABC-type ATPase
MTKSSDTPTIVVIAGPNGAGKSTSAPFLLKGALSVLEFVNADQIAVGLSAYAPEKVGENSKPR